MDLSRFTKIPGNVPWVAVFLERMPLGNLHTGIVYRDGQGRLHRLHFGWHHTLLHQQCRSQIACAIPILDPVESADEMFIAGFCGRIGRSSANKKIPYNLKIDDDVEFDTRTGAIRIGASFTGLSCATFVMAVFRSAGNSIINTTHWPPPDAEDRLYQRWFVNLLGQTGSADDLTQQPVAASELGTPRARPAHVAGACLEDYVPVMHPACELNGKALTPIMDQWAGTTPPVIPLAD